MPEPFEETEPLLLKGGIVVNHDTAKRADVLIQNGIIQDVGHTLALPEGTQIIDVTDQYIIPGGVDLDCHFTVPNIKDPVADTYLTGSQAAILGGTTTVVNSVYTEPDASLLEAFEQFLESSEGQWLCNYAVSIRIPRFDESVATDLLQLARDKGVAFAMLVPGSQDSTGIANKPTGELDEMSLHEALKACRKAGILPVVSASASPHLVEMAMADLRKHQTDIEFGPELQYYAQPERAEADTINKVALWAFHADSTCPVLVTRIQSCTALQCFLEQRKRCRGLLFGQLSIASIAAPLATREQLEGVERLLFTESLDWAAASAHVTEPPLRPDIRTAETLLVHLASSTADLTIGSGHRAIRTDVRAALGLSDAACIPRGVASVGCRLPALWSCAVESCSAGPMDPCTFVRCVSTGPARLANLYPQKGRIAPGSDADVVIWSKPDVWTNVGCDYLLPDGVPNLFAGMKLHSRPECVILRGVVVVKNGTLCSTVKPCGRFQPVEPFCQVAFSRVLALDRALKQDRLAIRREPYSGPIAGSQKGSDTPQPESHYFRKEHFDNVPKVALPPGQRQIHTSVKTAQPPGGSAHSSFW